MAYNIFDPTKPDAAVDSGTAFGTNTRNNLLAIRDMVTMGTMPGWAYSINGVIGTASISGNTMTVYGSPSFGAYAIGQTISGGGVASGTTLTAGSGSSWTTSGAPQSVASTTISAVTASQPENIYYTKGTEIIWAALTWGATGGSAGNVTVAVYSYSANSGATYSTIGTETTTYDNNSNAISTTWS